MGDQGPRGATPTARISHRPELPLVGWHVLFLDRCDAGNGRFGLRFAERGAQSSLTDWF
jgi:hypothetical protein